MRIPLWHFREHLWRLLDTRVLPQTGRLQDLVDRFSDGEIGWRKVLSTVIQGEGEEAFGCS
jgi:hypothetical protein